ncbi:TPA: GntR family transcriptional regulator [Legionella pneumophila]|nr:GntR family transcriptional regulator [Legionella pneumophila]
MASAMSPEVIAERIALAIREKVIQPGAPLIQEDLARRFAVSRSPVREALRILATEGLIDMTPGGGASVRRLDRAELNELYDLRILIEPTIAPAIVQNITTADLARMEMLVADMEGMSDIGQWMRANVAFHLNLYRAANLPRTAEILRSLLTAVQPYSQENIEQLGGRAPADREHRQMISAIRTGDAGTLSALFRSHLVGAKDRVGQHLMNPEIETDPLAALRG